MPLKLFSLSEKLELEEKKRLKSEAIAKTGQMIAHDVRKPFTMILAIIDSMISMDSNDEIKKLAVSSVGDIKEQLRL